MPSIAMSPLTTEQQREVSEIAGEEARGVVRSYRRNAILGFLVLLAGLSFTLHTESNHTKDARQAIANSGNSVAVAGCNRDFVDRAKIRRIILDSLPEIRTLEMEGALTNTQANRRRKSVRKALHQYPLPDCRPLAESITANPEEENGIPHALYPGDPKTKKALKEGK